MSIPSGNVDFAPTFLQMLGLPVPSSMQGRPLVEALRMPIAGRSTPSVRKTQQVATTSDGTYSQTAFFSIVRVGSNDYRYLDYTKVTRAKN